MASIASTAFVGTRVHTGRRAPLRSRPRFVVRASIENNRRKVLHTLLATAAVIPAAAISATNPQSRQQERQQQMGQGRSEIETQARGGRAQVTTPKGGQQQSGRGRDRGGQERGQIQAQPVARQVQNPAVLQDTRNRVNSFQRRFDQDVLQTLKSGDWDASRNNLRSQMASLRPDLNILVNAAPNMKRAQERNKAFQNSVDKLEVAIRQKNKDEALKQYDSAIERFGSTMSALG